MTSSEQHNVSQTSSEKKNNSQGTKWGNDRRRQRKIFLVYQTAACYVPKAKDQSALGKLYKCSPILPPLFSCISSKIYGEPTNDCATSWHCCLLFAAFFRAHLADVGLQFPQQLVEDLPKSCWPWLSLAEPVVSKQGMFCHVLVRTEPSAGLLLRVGNTGVIIIKFVLFKIFVLLFILIILIFFQKEIKLCGIFFMKGSLKVLAAAT